MIVFLFFFSVKSKNFLENTNINAEINLNYLLLITLLFQEKHSSSIGTTIMIKSLESRRIKSCTARLQQPVAPPSK